MKKIVIALFMLAVISSSCYRMPDEGEVSVLPVVNNPSSIRTAGAPIMPGIAC